MSRRALPASEVHELGEGLIEMHATGTAVQVLAPLSGDGDAAAAPPAICNASEQLPPQALLAPSGGMFNNVARPRFGSGGSGSGGGGGRPLFGLGGTHHHHHREGEGGGGGVGDAGDAAAAPAGDDSGSGGEPEFEYDTADRWGGGGGDWSDWGDTFGGDD